MRHVPVLLQEVLEALNLEAGKNIIDCTLGDAGHAEKILELTSPDGKLLGIDADAEAILRTKQFLYKFDERVVFARDNFENLRNIVKENKFDNVDGILMDYGWSSPQFEERGRGFSFLKTDEPLDMRYDTYLKCMHEAVSPPLTPDGRPIYGPCSAAELIDHKDVEGLSEMFRKYGEENLSKEIAEAIVEKRQAFPIETVGDLVDVILDVYRKKLKIPTESGQAEQRIPWVGGLHPATKVFQALRIAVNDELGVIERVLPQAIEVLKSGGRLAVITFHSIEDSIVKHYFKSQNNKTIKIITKKPVICSEEEREQNPRARSAKLRVIEKI
ncbi:MAG: 16S rRNA (cytosine(1402)-N(4))-methyltransferase [Candidatus Magasanikbacteria bacterium CG_4_10_14_0_2_um_filter_33_14]|uniref:Ribosomal RNA small subunit methyltransferase H n=1 Tax=Candidatus Magasanikbacteria bacterium CG_4_10_14_0_2_um_filter_33_14 TaxID=1974636 RepID=A0A2M7V8Y6_9BACT|nr:MAG: 16S rRNA (cytosine(1402)-N(4))-methyltransferase [Candidatus Magasanikbacteria bacterium CG_4_10_14_0_2_um_filter_33_14]